MRHLAAYAYHQFRYLKAFPSWTSRVNFMSRGEWNEKMQGIGCLNIPRLRHENFE